MHVFVYVNVGRLKVNAKSYLWVQSRDAFLLLNAACEKNNMRGYFTAPLVWNSLTNGQTCNEITRKEEVYYTQINKLRKKDVTTVHRLWYKEYPKGLLCNSQLATLRVTNKAKYENTNKPTVPEKNYGNGYKKNCLGS